MLDWGAEEGMIGDVGGREREVTFEGTDDGAHGALHGVGDDFVGVGRGFVF